MMFRSNSSQLFSRIIAEEERFELSRPFRACRFSKPVPSTTQPLFHKVSTMEAAQGADRDFVVLSFHSRFEAKQFASHPSQPLFLKRFENITYFCVLYKKWYYVLRSWPYRLSVRTEAFQASKRGSTPRRVMLTKSSA